MTPTELQQKRVLVAGLGVSGAAVVRYLVRSDVPFDAADSGNTDSVRLPASTCVHNTLSVAADYEVVILSPGIPRAHPDIVAAIDAGAQVIGDIELFASVVGDVPVVAVTGSNGKSTVVAWLAHVLHECGLKALACGNIGLSALDALNESASVYVLELSSYQLESVTRLQPLVAVALNVSEDHLDRYASLDDYAAVKRHVYSAARFCVTNALDDRTQPAQSLGSCDARVFATDKVPPSVGAGQPVCWHFCLGTPMPGSLNVAAANESLQTLGPQLCRNGKNIVDAALLSVPGLHNASNALMVLALAECLQQGMDMVLDRESLVRALGGWPGLPHRTALVADHAGVRWYDDSKGTNVDACIKAIEAMPGPVVLIAGGLSKGADFSPLADVAREHVKHVVLIGRDRGVLREVLQGCTELSDAESMSEAVSVARAAAAQGDVVLLSPACSSFDMFKDYVARGLAFQDAVTVTAQVAS